MEPIGDRLRRAREARKLSLRDVAGATKISVTALEAIERGDLTRVPGGIYGRSFVRTYAAQLGLPADDLVRSFGEELARQQGEAAQQKARPRVTDADRDFLERQRRALRRLRLAVIATVLVVVAAAVWYGMTRYGASDDPAAPDAADSGTAPPPQLPPPPAAPPPSAGSPTQTAALPPPPPAAATPATSAPEADGLVIEVTVTGDCWINVRADGQVVLERVLQRGETQRFTAQQSIVLDVGDAGVMDWTINGRAARRIGGQGQHRRATITRENAASFLR
jgi:cytoskeletal protein RodZ